MCKFKVGKKYKSTVYNDVYTYIGSGEVYAHFESTRPSYLCLDKTKLDHMSEVREPRVIYVNEYEKQYYKHLGVVEDKNTFGVPKFSQQLAKEALISRPGVTRKFIEVLD